MSTAIMADVAVVGAGPAGMAAALAAADLGCRVILVDAGPAMGGQIYRAPASGVPAFGSSGHAPAAPAGRHAPGHSPFARDHGVARDRAGPGAGDFREGRDRRG